MQQYQFNRRYILGISFILCPGRLSFGFDFAVISGHCLFCNVSLTSMLTGKDLQPVAWPLVPLPDVSSPHLYQTGMAVKGLMIAAAVFVLFLAMVFLRQDLLHCSTQCSGCGCWHGFHVIAHVYSEISAASAWPYGSHQSITIGGILITNLVNYSCAIMAQMRISDGCSVWVLAIRGLFSWEHCGYRKVRVG